MGVIIPLLRTVNETPSLCQTGMQPYFDLTRKTTLKKNGRRRQKKIKNGRPPQKKMEDDLTKNKNILTLLERQPQKKMKTT